LVAIPFAVTAGLDGPAGAFQAARDPGEVPLGVRLLQDVRTLFTARKVDQMRAAPIVPLKAIEEARAIVSTALGDSSDEPGWE
jgi:hypothetical protein